MTALSCVCFHNRKSCSYKGNKMAPITAAFLHSCHVFFMSTGLSQHLMPCIYVMLKISQRVINPALCVSINSLENSGHAQAHGQK